MKKLLLVAALVGVAVLAACSEQTKEKASETVDAAKTDIAKNTAEVAKEAEAAAQNTANVAKDGVQAVADKTSEVAKKVGAATDAATNPEANPDSAEAKVPEEQKY
ncbi:MAG: entericidin [Moraxella sp.]|nr:entericidin [Moraxella sp.]